jgi:predicted nucleic acid-binding protein
VIDINDEIKSNVIGLRRESYLKLPDCIVAATARFLNIPLMTADVDFKSIKSTEVIIYE